MQLQQAVLDVDASDAVPVERLRTVANSYWNGNIAILTKFSSFSAL